MKNFDRHYPIHIQNTSEIANRSHCKKASEQLKQDVEAFLAKDGIIREYDNVGQEIIK